MNIVEFIDTQYNVIDKIKRLLTDPYEMVMKENDLPYDTIGPGPNGKPTKLVEVDEGRYIPVLELVSYSPGDPELTQDEALQIVYNAYMSQIETVDVDLTNLVKILSEYKQHTDERSRLLNVLHS